MPAGDVDISEDNNNNIEEKEKGLSHYVFQIYILNKHNKFYRSNNGNEFMLWIFVWNIY